MNKYRRRTNRRGREVEKKKRQKIQEEQDRRQTKCELLIGSRNENKDTLLCTTCVYKTKQRKRSIFFITKQPLKKKHVLTFK